MGIPDATTNNDGGTCDNRCDQKNRHGDKYLIKEIQYLHDL
jgi:hypothetical protein